MTNEEHNKFIAIAFLIHGGFQLLMFMMLTAFFFFIFSVPGQPRNLGPPAAFFGFFFGIMFLVQLVFTAPSFVAAYALLKRKSWARIAGIVAGAMSAMHMPIGTAVGVYSMWFFF